MKKRMIAVAVACVVGLVAQAQAVELKTQEQRYSYTLGTRMANLLRGQGIGKVDGEAFGAGVADVINKAEMRLSADEMTEALRVHTLKLRAEREELAKKKLEEGKAFLAENAKKPGITVLDSGLQYEVLKSGEGESPKATDTVTVHYEGKLISGKKFDSSYDRGQPATFGVNKVIKGFGEALMHMKPGAKWRVYIPSELAYGVKGTSDGSIAPNEVLIFDLELLKVTPAPAQSKSTQEEQK